ncbi:hypothetical protein [Actinokineospora diospyrosa]|uniref:Pyrroloquinoline-quinone binding quinoprotein n=1 Tax=Actinokineospora diospyrosa TaxID=103728 RepID=A0ABT1IJ86_9PSEU|nr:hypothetical protein [Actinokineospora diospyrosa]MCP2272705.1 hypothetical protein [Actinokineospora diospyrosa]
MTVTDRLIRIVWVPDVGLIAADTFGRIHLFDDELRLVRSSARVRAGRPLYGLTVAGDWVIGKDRMGAVYRWSLATFDLLNRVDPVTVCDRSSLLDGEEPSPVSSRGIAVWAGRVYVTSGYHNQMLVLDLETFDVLEIRPNICGDAVMEWVSTDSGKVHVVSDKNGGLWFGDFETMSFPKHVKIDDGNIHRVVYDKLHDRFWCTQDFGEGETADVANGVIVVSLDGVKEGESLFARDDVEFIHFAKDYRRAYAGGFDGELHIYDNTDRALRIVRTISGFPHQLSDLTIDDRGDLYVLCQDGEVVKLDAEGAQLGRLGFRRQAVWDIQHAVEDDGVLYLASDSGVAVAQVVPAASGPTLRVLADHVTGHGFTRRVAPVPGGFVGVTRDGRVLRAGRDGTQRWNTGLPGLLHTVAAAPDFTRLLVAGNEGAFELDADTGAVTTVHQVDGLPVWVSAYLPDGRAVLGTRNGVIVVLEADGTPGWRLDQGEYPKRMWTSGELLYVVGDGGLKEIEIGTGVTRRWTELLSNTNENAVLVDGLVSVSSYGMQVATYGYDDGELVGFVEELPDYPKALAAVRDQHGAPHLLVGARSGILSLYRFVKPGGPGGVLAKVEDRWLPRRQAAFALAQRDW